MTESGIVSIVIPTYNGERFIESTIRSALGQNGVEVEVVVVDDHSTDGTMATLERFSEVIVRRTPRRLGSDLASNYGVSYTHGESFALLGHDDVLLPEKTRTLLSVIEGTDADIAYGDAITIDESDKEIGSIKGLPFTDPESLIRRNIILLGASLLKRRFWDRYGGLRDFEGYGDYDLWLRACTDWKPAYRSSWVLRYRQHNGQLGHVARWPILLSQGNLPGAFAAQAKQFHIWLLLREIRRQARIRLQETGFLAVDVNSRGV